MNPTDLIEWDVIFSVPTLGMKRRHSVVVVENRIQMTLNPYRMSSRPWITKDTVTPTMHITTTLYTLIAMYLKITLLITTGITLFQNLFYKKIRVEIYNQKYDQ